MTFAPPWAVTAEAIDGTGDTHLPQGVHVRALPSPRAGVPATPLFVFRTDLPARVLERLGSRQDVTWVDSAGNVLTVPFAVTPGNPVVGHLPAGQCVWARLAAKPSRGFAFEALATSAQGPAVIGRRVDSPFVLAGQRIDAVRVSGSGQVTGFRWMAGDELDRQKSTLVAVWSLPVRPMAWYRPTAGAAQEAKDRLLGGAPVRQPMYAAFASAGPAAAPPATPDDARERVELVVPELMRWLAALLDDPGTRPADVVDEAAIDQVSGSVSIPVEPHVIATAVDPDAGRWLGFGDVDRDVKAEAGAVAVYRIRGLWRWDPDHWDAFQRLALAAHLRPSLGAAVQAFPELKQAGLVPEKDGRFLDLTALAVAALGHPPARPGPPQPLTFEDRGWLPEPPPPGVRRGVRLRAGGFLPHVVAALAAEDSRGLRSLNAVFQKGRPRPGETPEPRTIMPLTVTRPVDATSPGQGRFDDREAPEEPVDYRLAQGDWFGRWSEWAEAAAPAKARTAPRPPTLELAYAPPTFPSGLPLPDPPERGTLTVRVPVPRPPELPAGGHRLFRLEVERRVDGGAPATFTFVLGALAGAVLEPHPSPGHDVLVFTSPGPPVPRAGSRQVRVTARWVDEGGLVSPDSAPAVRDLLDPRPPPLPPVPTELQYSARPDSTGFARVELSWPSSPGVRYRVFASTETTLIGSLRNAGLGAAADVVQAAPAGAPRAMALRARKSDFGWGAFECVTASPIVASGATTTFVHRVSGSLDVLAVYRVLSEGASGVLAEMTQADLIPVAVPNSGPPAQPLVSVERQPEDHEHHGVALRVRVPPGLVVPVAWRLRRASVAVNDPLRMDVVATGAIPPGTGTAAAGTELTITDPTPLRRWRQYRFSVEVQAGLPPGAPTVGVIPIGEWSPASAPATVAVIPADGPAAPTSVTAMREAAGVRLTVAHPDAGALVGTPFGSHRFEVYRLTAGTRPALVEVALVRGPGLTFAGVDTAAPAAASRWAVRIVDPLGRASETLVSGEA